jgi:hypothetical protein
MASPVDFAAAVAIRSYLVAAKCSCPGGEIGSTRAIRQSRFNVDLALQQYLSAHVADGVNIDKTQNEHNESGYPPITDKGADMVAADNPES